MRGLGPAQWVALMGCAAAGCATPPLLSEAAAAEALQRLHAPLPRVYELSADRDAVHDHLAQSLYGEALTREYVAVWAALRRMEAAASTVKIEAVEVEAVERVSAQPLRLELAWTVTGEVWHGEHSHRRANRYRAVYTLAETAEGLRIVDVQAKDHQRLHVPEALGEARGLLELAQ